MSETTAPQTFDEALAALPRLKQRLFVQFYLGLIGTKDGAFSKYNASKSARFAGYAAKEMNNAGFQIQTNTGIRRAIDLGLSEHIMPRAEVLDRVGEQARGSMEDFISLEEVEYQPPISIPAYERREQLHSRIADASEQQDLAGDDDTKAAWQKVIDQTQGEIDDLPDNPLELVQIKGPIQKTVVAKIDLIKAEKLGKLHLLKKLKQTERGLEIELYDAQSALELIGKHYKLWADRMSLENPNGSAITFIVDRVNSKNA